MLDKKFSVYDSQIWCQQGRAIVRNLATPLGRRDSSMKKKMIFQPRPQGLLAFQYGGGRREDPGTQRANTIADWCILLRVHTCALIGLFIPKQRWSSFEGFVQAEKCFLQCLRPKWWTEFGSDCSENCDCTVARQRFEDSDIWNGNRWEYYKA